MSQQKMKPKRRLSTKKTLQSIYLKIHQKEQKQNKLKKLKLINLLKKTTITVDQAAPLYKLDRNCLHSAAIE